MIVILYDNDNNLVGVSKDTLSFLGYEDMDEFKTYTNDVADLFIAKSGYVHKFNNFSWIDYVLHSGAANKNAIVRLKNGKEVEIEIIIKEILLSNPSKDNEFFYNVELRNFLSMHGSVDIKSEDNAQPFAVLENEKEIISKADELKSREEKEIKEKKDELEEDLSIKDNSLQKISLKLSSKEKTPEKIDKNDENIEIFGLKNEDTFEPQSSFAKNEEKDGFAIDEVDKEEKEGFEISKKDEFVLFGNEKIDNEKINEDVGFDIKIDKEDIKQEDDTFLKAHALPKKDIQEPKSELNIQKSADFLGVSEDIVKDYTKEYLGYANKLDSKFFDYIKNKDEKNMRQIAIQLRSLADILCIENLSVLLRHLCEKYDDKAEKFYHEYKEDLENLQRIQI